MFKLASAKLTGNPGTSGWAQVHEFTPEDSEKLSLRGRLSAVVATGRHEEGVDAVSAGRELLARLHEEYFGNLEAPAFYALKSAVEKVMKEFENSWGEVEIGAVAYLGDVVYSVVGGGAQISIFRNGILAKILTSEKAGVVSASGYPQGGDMLIVGTKLFFDSLSSGVIKGALESGGPDAAIEAMAPLIHGRPESGSLGAIVLHFQKGDEVIETVLPQAEEKKPIEIGNKIKGFISPFVSKVTKVILDKLPEKRIYIRGVSSDEEASPQRRMMLTIGAILLVLLIVSIGFGIRQKALKDSKGRYEERLTQATHEFDEALGLSSLNPDRARELFASSKTIAESLKNEGVKDKALDELIVKLNESKGAILGEYNLESQLFVDLSLQTSGFDGQDVASSGETIFVLDKNSKKIISVEFDTKKTQVFAGPDQMASPDKLASYEDRAFILEGDGIYEVGDKRVKAIEKAWEGEVLPHAYAGNFYVLDKAGSMIWRYPGAGSEFGQGQKWLGAGITPNFSGVVSITIDGAIFVLFDTGRISKFSLGSPQALGVSGVFPDLTSGTSIYTNESLKNIYVLDKNSKRIVVLDKEGKYKAQYYADKLGNAHDLAVSEKEGKIVFLAETKLYYLEIKH